MKNELRGEMKGLLEEQSPEERERKSKRILGNLLALPEYKKAKTILSYVSLDSEASTKGFIGTALAEGKKVLVPAVKEGCLTLHRIKTLGELAPGFAGIPEPKDCSVRASLGDVDLAVMPGLAFDENGNRLGRGRGMFDRLFSKGGCCRVALAYDFQVIESVPSAPHDIPVNAIVTEKRVIRTKAGNWC